MIVQKFGGTSVGSAKRIKEVADLINDGNQKIVVLSAVGGTTNKLQEVYNCLVAKDISSSFELLKQIKTSYFTLVDELFETQRTKDFAYQFIIKRFVSLNYQIITNFNANTIESIYSLILTEGEQFSTYLLCQYLLENNSSATLIQAADFIHLDVNNEPNIEGVRERLKGVLANKKEKIIITQGFVCRDNKGNISNLKRGGSDYTASLIGAALNAQEVQIWTDIDGMHNNDPRFVTNTRSIPYLSYNEAADLSYFGASILHPSTIIPAQKYNIPIRIKNTFSPGKEGTCIKQAVQSDGISAIASKDNIVAINIISARTLLAPGFLTKIFEVFERYNTAIDMLSTSETSVSMTIDDKSNLDNIIKELNFLGTVEVNDELSIICVVGYMEGESKGIVNSITEPLKNIPIHMIAYGGSKHNLSFLVKTQMKKNALEALQNNLF